MQIGQNRANIRNWDETPILNSDSVSAAKNTPNSYSAGSKSVICHVRPISYMANLTLILPLMKRPGETRIKRPKIYRLSQDQDIFFVWLYYRAKTNK